MNLSSPSSPASSLSSLHGISSQGENKQQTPKNNSSPSGFFPEGLEPLRSDLFSPGKLLLEWESQLTKQRATFVIVGSASDNGDVHTTWTVNLVDVDLVEHGLLG